jgi:HSP20 family molecular chaperone IbpA
MLSGQELPVQQKREMEQKQEATAPVRVFVPVTDIYETEDGLTLLMEMPGVDKANVEVDVKDGVLTVQGRVDFSKYEELSPVYTEYNIGNYRRAFTISNKIDLERIGAEMTDGVLKLTLPKAKEITPRRIAVN